MMRHFVIFSEEELSDMIDGRTVKDPETDAVYISQPAYEQYLKDEMRWVDDD